MNIRDLPFYNRPIFKIKELGPEKLDNAELLSILMYRGNSTGSALELSSKLLSLINLDKFSNCSLKELKHILKDETKSVQIIALAELFKRYSKIKRKGYTKQIDNPQDVYNMLYDDLKDKKQESFYVILLNSQNKIIKTSEITRGTIDKVIAHPREIFSRAIKEAASSIIIVHNHPSGSLEASSEDIKITRKIKEAGDILGINVLDHIIIGDGWKQVDIN